MADSVALRVLHLDKDQSTPRCVGLGRLDDASFAIKFIDAEGKATHLALSPEAMAGLVTLYQKELLLPAATHGSGGMVASFFDDPPRWEIDRV